MLIYLSIFNYDEISMPGNHNLKIPRYFQVCYISIKYRARCTVNMKKCSILIFTHVSNYTLICFRKPKKVTSDFPIDFKFQHSKFCLIVYEPYRPCYKHK